MTRQTCHGIFAFCLWRGGFRAVFVHCSLAAKLTPTAKASGSAPAAKPSPPAGPPPAEAAPEQISNAALQEKLLLEYADQCGGFTEHNSDCIAINCHDSFRATVELQVTDDAQTVHSQGVVKAAFSVVGRYWWCADDASG